MQVRDPAAWKVAPHSCPGGDPFVAALDAVTVVCSRILQDTGMLSTVAQPYPLSPSKVWLASYMADVRIIISPALDFSFLNRLQFNPDLARYRLT